MTQLISLSVVSLQREVIRVLGYVDLQLVSVYVVYTVYVCVERKEKVTIRF